MAIMNNVCEHDDKVFFESLISPFMHIYQEMELLDYMLIPFILIQFPKVAIQLYILNSNAQEFQCLMFTSLIALCFLIISLLLFY